jgi:hypothetical protein
MIRMIVREANPWRRCRHMIPTAGRRWRVRYRTPDWRQTDKRGSVTKRDAREFAATIEVRKEAGHFVSE